MPSRLIAGHMLEIAHVPAARSGLPTLVFLHEGLGCIALWRDFPQRLARATGCGALLYSRHGYGQSAPLTGPRQDDYLHHEALVVLPELLAAEGIADPVLIGHSDGASIALIHAGAARWRVRGVSAQAPHVFVEDVTITGILAARRAFRETDMEGRLGRYHRDPSATFRGWNDTWLRPSFRQWNIESFLPGITCPTLLIQGIGDEYATLAQLDAIAGQVSGEVMRLDLADCGHTPFRDQPEKVLDAHVQWIAGLT